MPKTYPPTPDQPTSADVEARKILGVRAKATNRSAPPKSAASNGATVGGKSLKGGARVRGGRA
jgi:hypothetical protein